MTDVKESLAAAMQKINLDIKARGEVKEENLKEGAPINYLNFDTIPETRVDITDKFEKACRELQVGQLVKSAYFNPYEAMSAIEMMDEKMDVGMKKLDLDSLHLNRAIETGRINVENMPRSEIIATMDCTFAAMASWLNGQSLDQTLFTNILLQDWTLIKEPTLKAFCKGILEVFQQFRDVITSAGTCRDEDFLVHFYADVNVDTTGCVIDLTKEIRRLNKLIDAKNKKIKAKEGKDYKSTSHPTELTCVRDRLELVLEMLNVVRHFIGFESTDSVSSSSRSNSIVADSLKVESFRPNFAEAFDACRRCGVLLMMMTKTFKQFGLNPTRDQLQEEEEEDFTFDWLPAFNYDLNRRLLPAAFPRKRDLMSRVEGLTYFTKLFELLLLIPMDDKNSVPDLNRLLEDVRMFSSTRDSCVLSRSFLQIVVIPTEQKIFGNFDIRDVVQESIRAGVPLNYIQDDNPQAVLVEKEIEGFIADASRCFISIIQIYGHNKARRRDLINESLEDLNVLLHEASAVDNVTLGYLMNKADTKDPKDVIEEVMPSLYGFVLQYAFSLMYYHFQLGFDLDLFEVYEYPYVFWYVSRIILQWFNVVEHRHRQLADTDSKINDLLQKPVQDNSKNGKKKKGKGKTKATKPRELSNQEKRDAQLRKAHLDYLALHIEKKRLLNMFTEAILKTVLVLQDAQQFFTPDNEEDRFNARMEKFKVVREVRIFTYDVFHQFVLALKPMQHRQLLTEAASTFKQFLHVNQVNEIIRELVYCCKRNTVVLNLLANDTEFNKREVVYEFINADLDVIPVLNIGTKS
uniref:Protein MAK10 homolog n=1 Tax=Steinernema glaseri TaxID=37863 RepID=A0A1I7Y9N1_9BILA